MCDRNRLSYLLSFPSFRLCFHGATAPTSRMGSFLAVVSFWVSHTSSVYATKALLSRPGRTTRGIVVITWCQVMRPS